MVEGLGCFGSAGLGLESRCSGLGAGRFPCGSLGQAESVEPENALHWKVQASCSG